MTRRLCRYEGCDRPALGKRGPAVCSAHFTRNMPKKPKASNIERGYGAEHVHLRRKYLDELNRVGQLHCWRCGGVILPDMPWHLGHDDWDRSKYRGPEHAKCNTAAAARKTNMIRRGRALEQSTRRKSRRW